MSSRRSNDEQSDGAHDEPSDGDAVDEQSVADAEADEEVVTDAETDEEVVTDAEADEEVMTTSLDKQSLALRELLVSAIERIRAGQDLTAPEVDAIRTEVEELQAVIEEFLVGRCDDTEPWEATGIHIPRERLEERLEELSEK